MSKLKSHECKSLKEFNKICRKYIKYFGLRFNHNYHSLWYTWLWVDFIGIEKIKSLIPYANKLASKNQPNLKYIIQEVLDNFNWSFISKEGIKYFLQGIEITNEDYYYVYLSDTGDKRFMSCVGSFDSINHY